eukprot:7386960-Prymnesium_polylepis.1
MCPTQKKVVLVENLNYDDRFDLSVHRPLGFDSLSQICIPIFAKDPKSEMGRTASNLMVQESWQNIEELQVETRDRLQQALDAGEHILLDAVHAGEHRIHEAANAVRSGVNRLVPTASESSCPRTTAGGRNEGGTNRRPHREASTLEDHVERLARVEANFSDRKVLAVLKCINKRTYRSNRTGFAFNADDVYRAKDGGLRLRLLSEELLREQQASNVLAHFGTEAATKAAHQVGTRRMSLSRGTVLDANIGSNKGTACLPPTQDSSRISRPQGSARCAASFRDQESAAVPEAPTQADVTSSVRTSSDGDNFVVAGSIFAGSLLGITTASVTPRLAPELPLNPIDARENSVFEEAFEETWNEATPKYFSRTV